MNKLTRLYFEACKELHLNPVEIAEIHGFQFTLGKKSYFFRKGATPFNNISAASIAMNKYSTNLLLNSHHIPVPKAFGITRSEYQQGLLDISHLQFPLVIKPCWDSSSGKGVICNIPTLANLKQLLKHSFQKKKAICIEEFQVNLRSYRVLVFNGEVIGLLERIPAHVVGDGHHTISQLIEIENVRRRILNKKLPYGPLKMNEETDYIFKERGINANYVPHLDEKISILYVCNSGAGGTTVGLSLKNICCENKQIAVRAAKILDLHLVGLDFLCEDISKPITQTRGFVIEANAAPDISIHENTPYGEVAQVSSIIMKKFIYQNLFSYCVQRCHGKYALIIIKTLVVLAIIIGTGKALSAF
ncbi:MAG: UDP-N-acetylmuramyl peptide synthase [Candidatus Berkiella sp.]